MESFEQIRLLSGLEVNFHKLTEIAEDNTKQLFEHGQFKLVSTWSIQSCVPVSFV